MKVKYEEKDAMTLIGYHTEIHPEEAYRKCTAFWDEEYMQKYKRLWQTMKPETDIEQAMLDNDIGMYGICVESKNAFTYWIAGLYKGGNVPDGLELFSFPASQWAMFTAKGAIPDALQTLNTAVWQEWFPSEGKKHHANGKASLEVYSIGDMHSADYECGIWIPCDSMEG